MTQPVVALQVHVWAICLFSNVLPDNISLFLFVSLQNAKMGHWELIYLGGPPKYTDRAFIWAALLNSTYRDHRANNLERVLAHNDQLEHPQVISENYMWLILACSL